MDPKSRRLHTVQDQKYKWLKLQSWSDNNNKKSAMRDSRVSISDSLHARTDRLLSINKSQMKSDSRIYTVIKTHEPRRLNEPKEK